jgi:hypothetical protein
VEVQCDWADLFLEVVSSSLSLRRLVSNYWPLLLLGIDLSLFVLI